MSKMDDIKWTGNSRKMYEEILGALPPLYRAAVKKKFEVLVNKSETKIISEIDIKKSLEEYAPDKYLKALMPIYEQYKSEF